MSDVDVRREIVALAPETASAAAIEAMLADVLANPSAVSSIVVPPPFAKRCVEALRGSGVTVSSVVGFPLGLSKPTIKAIEATSLAKDGVDVIEVTPYPSSLIDGDWDALRAELLEIVRGARAARPSVSIVVRADVALPGLQSTLFESLAAAVLRSACEGTIVESSRVDLVPALAYPGERVRVRRQSDRHPS